MDSVGPEAEPGTMLKCFSKQNLGLKTKTRKLLDEKAYSKKQQLEEASISTGQSRVEQFIYYAHFLFYKVTFIIVSASAVLQKYECKWYWHSTDRRTLDSPESWQMIRDETTEYV